jgi:hypothetical protein
MEVKVTFLVMGRPIVIEPGLLVYHISTLLPHGKVLVAVGAHYRFVEENQSHFGF